MHKGSLDTVVPSWQISSINLVTTSNASSTLGEDVVTIPSVSAPRSKPTTVTPMPRGNQQRRPPHAPRYFENSDSGTHLPANGSTSSAQRHSESRGSPSIRPSQFDAMERTASGSSTYSGSSKRKREFTNTHQPSLASSSVGAIAAAAPSKGLAERLGIALPPNGSGHAAAHGEDGQDQDPAQQQQNKKRKAKVKPNQLGHAGENGENRAAGQKPTSGTGNLTPGMSLLQRLNMGGGGSSNVPKPAANSPSQSNGGPTNGRSNGQSTRVPPRGMPNAQQRNPRPNHTQPIRPNASSNAQPNSLPSNLSQMSMNNTPPLSAPSGPASNRLKLSTTPSNPASLISRLSGAPAHARSPIPMAPIAPHGLVKSAPVTSMNGDRAPTQGNMMSGNAREQIRPLGPVVGQTRPAVVESAPAALPFNPNDGIKRKGRGFANAGYAL